MVTTDKRTKQNGDTQYTKRKNRGWKLGIPSNKYITQKHKEKETIEAESYQKRKDKMAIGNPHTS